MSVIDDYLDTLTAPQKAEFGRMRSVLATVIPPTEDGVSYGMPAMMYKDKPVVSLIVRKEFLSLYPFSGKVVMKLESELKGFETTSGSVHFTVEKPLPDNLLKKIARARMEEIDSKTGK